jgi:hypothetical protein
MIILSMQKTLLETDESLETLGSSTIKGAR